MTDLAVLLVHYRTPELLVEAVRALEIELDSAGLRAEIWVIDNGSTADDRRSWSELPIRRIDPGRNLGYAGGVQAGVEASSAPFLVAMNPDVLVGEGCLERLHGALAGGAAAAGPLFTWDRGGRLLLPPTESRSLWAELQAALARRHPEGRRLPGWARRAWRRHARQHWLAAEPLASFSLSGALLAFRRDAWNQIGPFDDAFQLYFEETDWLLRLRAAGLQALFVPTARAVHLYAQSSVREPRAAAWFAEAERRFRRRHLGSASAWLLEQIGRPGSNSHSAPFEQGHETIVLRPEAGRAWTPGSWVEVALSPLGFPAAGELLSAGASQWSLPAEILGRLAGQTISLRVVGASGEESTVVEVAVPPKEAPEEEVRE